MPCTGDCGSFGIVCPIIILSHVTYSYIFLFSVLSDVVMSRVSDGPVLTLTDLSRIAVGHRVCTHLALKGGGLYATVGNADYYPSAPTGRFMPPVLGIARCGSHTKFYHPIWDGPNVLPPYAAEEILNREFGEAVTVLLGPVDLCVCNMTWSPSMRMPPEPEAMCFTGPPAHSMYWLRARKRCKTKH